MRKSVPDFVFKHGGTEKDWHSVHDIVHRDKKRGNYLEEAEKWWLTNYKIRKALEEMEKEISNNYDNSNFLRKKFSVSDLKRITKLFSGSIYHKKRKNWVLERVDQIERIRQSVLKRESIEQSIYDKRVIVLEEKGKALMRQTVALEKELMNAEIIITNLRRDLVKKDKEIQSLRNLHRS